MRPVTVLALGLALAGAALTGAGAVPSLRVQEYPVLVLLRYIELESELRRALTS